MLQPTANGSGKFFCGFALAIVLVLGSVAAASWTLDVAGAYHSKSAAAQEFADNYAQRLIESSHGLLFVNRERAIKIAIARRHPGDCYVTGSSRHLGVSAPLLPALAGECRQSTNLAVSGGTLEDAFIFAAEAVQRAEPRILIFGLDPWMFRRHSGAGWIEFEDEYSAARAHFGIERRAGASIAAAESVLRKFENLINFHYLWRSIVNWLRQEGRPDRPEIIAVSQDRANVPSDRSVLLPDGRQVPSETELAKGSPPDHLIGDGGYRLQDPLLNPVLIGEFEVMLKSLRQRGISVRFLLIPYHPKVWQCRRPSVCKSLLSIEAVISEIARRHGIPVVGGYRPDVFGLERAHYTDDIHIVPEALARLR